MYEARIIRNPNKGQKRNIAFKIEYKSNDTEIQTPRFESCADLEALKVCMEAKASYASIMTENSKNRTKKSYDYSIKDDQIIIKAGSRKKYPYRTRQKAFLAGCAARQDKAVEKYLNGEFDSLKDNIVTTFFASNMMSGMMPKEEYEQYLLEHPEEPGVLVSLEPNSEIEEFELF